MLYQKSFLPLTEGLKLFIHLPLFCLEVQSSPLLELQGIPFVVGEISWVCWPLSVDVWLVPSFPGGSELAAFLCPPVPSFPVVCLSLALPIPPPSGRYSYYVPRLSLTISLTVHFIFRDFYFRPIMSKAIHALLTIHYIPRFLLASNHVQYYSQSV